MSPMHFHKFKTTLSYSMHQVIFPPLLKISSIVTSFKKPNLKSMTQNHSLQCYWQMISQRKSPKENDEKGENCTCLVKTFFLCFLAVLVRSRYCISIRQQQVCDYLLWLLSWQLPPSKLSPLGRSSRSFINSRGSLLKVTKNHGINSFSLRSRHRRL